MSQTYYNELVAGARWLKNLDPLAVDPQQGITQDDLTAAERAAYLQINVELAGLFSKTERDSWQTAANTPPLINEIADSLSSALVLGMKHDRDNLQPEDGLAAERKAWAEESLAALSNNLISLEDPDGNVISTNVDRGPRVQNREDKPFSGYRWKRNQFSDGR